MTLPYFPSKTSHHFSRKAKAHSLNDPLAKQYLIDPLEQIPNAHLPNDALDELNSNPCPGLIHKYHGRVLILTTGACAIHCRYCFRRHFPYNGQSLNPMQWQTILNYIQADPSIEEVILSGGDPLVLSERRLSNILQDLLALKQLKTIRIHSRMPVVDPNKIAMPALLIAAKSSISLILVCHCNHPNELDQASLDLFTQLKTHGTTLLNQSVLLKGVNDNIETLTTLSKALFDQGLLPYYLHMLDELPENQHFTVLLKDAQTLMWDLAQRLPGYLVPKLVKEIPHVGSKCPIAYGPAMTTPVVATPV